MGATLRSNRNADSTNSSLSPLNRETQDTLIGIMKTWLLEIPWSLLIIACLTLGLAPFAPPHIVEKLRMLFRGTLVRPIDWLDLVFHGIPWLLLILKAWATATK